MSLVRAVRGAVFPRFSYVGCSPLSIFKVIASADAVVEALVALLHTLAECLSLKEQQLADFLPQ